MKLKKYIYYLAKLNNKIVSYKYGDNLDYYINTNKKILKGGGQYDSIIRSFIDTTGQYTDLVNYLLLNLTILSYYFSDKQLIKLKNQIGQIDKLIKEKKLEIDTL